ncbi:MAG: Do family serine endopeptidase [Helicobacter sp.]|nr:Do family serine endopeptidase [Helicobacter sp.]
MKTSLLLAAILLSLGQIQAFDAKEAPAITQRSAPNTNSNTIYSYHDSIKNALNAVVSIQTQKRIRSQQQNIFNDPFFQQFFGDFYRNIPRDRIERALGSGTIISSDGYIITNNHVIDGADKILVTLPGSSREYSAKLIGTDPDTDLVVIQIDAKNLPFLSFANSNDVAVGDVVFAIGNPFGVGETVTQGIISAINKNSVGINNYENFIQTDTSINPGNSGGALIDSRGALVGINTAILSHSGGNVGIGFAIPANITKNIATQLIQSGRIERGYLGVGTQDVSNDLRETYNNQDGAVVINIEPNTPAQKAGIMIWDLITKIDGTPIKSASDLKNLIGSKKPGTKITLTILRDKKERTITLSLDKRGGNTQQPAAAKQKPQDGGELKGLKVEALTPQIRSQFQIPRDINGVIIAAVQENSPAETAGFTPGTIISRVENVEIKSLQDFQNALSKFRNKSKRFLVFTPQGQIQTIVAK